MYSGCRGHVVNSVINNQHLYESNGKKKLNQINKNISKSQTIYNNHLLNSTDLNLKRHLVEYNLHNYGHKNESLGKNFLKKNQNKSFKKHSTS